MPPDPGLQPERTALAWHRTALSGAAFAAALIRLGVHSWAFGWIAAIATAVVLVSLAVTVRGSRIYHRRSTAAADRQIGKKRGASDVFAIGIGTLLLAALGGLVGFTHG